MGNSKNKPGSHINQYYEAHVKVCESEIKEIEVLTRDQSEGCDIYRNKWKAERRKRLTSSMMGQIARRRSSTKVAKLVKTLLYSSFKGNAATSWGITQESCSKKQYLSKVRAESSSITVSPSGLVISIHHPWIAASPDGLVNDPSSSDPFGLVEYKNPYSHRNSDLQTAAKSKDFCLTVNVEGKLCLKKTHHYYYQLQGAMFCTDRKWCDFVVRTNEDLHIERITWDTDFWNNSLPKLKYFYFTALLPELAQPRLQHGGIREPGEWLQNKDEWNTFLSNLLKL